MFGFTGNILHVDLTTRTLEIETPSEMFYRDYIGGSLLGLYYLTQFTPAGISAFDPQNTLTFAVGPATGLPISGQSRCTATCKSPTTGGIADSQAGGFWPAELKFAGFDAVVIRGRASEPLYLLIKDGRASLHSASHLWGKPTLAVDQQLKAEWNDPKLEIAQIGRAGEQLVNFAAVMNMSNRAWGRTGVGAVMGSKNLKAIVVRGTGKVMPADKATIAALSKWGAKELPTNADVASLGKYGTAGVVMPQYGAGGLPSFNWNSGIMPTETEAELISGERLYDELLAGAAEGKQDRKGRDTCYACLVRCKRVVQSEWQGTPIIPEYGGPEYETISTFGSYCGISDLHAVSLANQLCNEYGVDTISCGATLSWAMECFENGVLTLADTDGIDLRFGNAPAMLAMLEKTLRREGLGDVLANGSAQAAKQLGRGHDYLLTVKGQELPAHMPQVKRSLALIYAANPFGADHQSSEHDPLYSPENYPTYQRFLQPIGLTDPQPEQALTPEKVNFALRTQYTYSMADTMSVCQFVYGPGWQLYGPQEMAQLLQAATGWQISVEEIQRLGQKRLNLMRAYNAREGLDHQQDTLPRKLFTKPLQGGMSDGVKLSQQELADGLQAYYALAGWSPSGVPTAETLAELGLGGVL
ncbi:MAG TPA: aldehyde ferredoxin oxidoreductase family protein [Anaerolineales bacterium]|nr:aldehyde ferredoxin oxidoreductase family protein [Anaerolineales bacterium]